MQLGSKITRQLLCRIEVVPAPTTYATATKTTTYAPTTTTTLKWW
jgi:hypothetical protein